jgi:AcrR family transcriptional regulator
MARPKDPNAKSELLSAAAQVFVHKGVEQARIEDITALAGRSKGSFYLHFKSKEDAFGQIVESFLTRMAASMSPPPMEVPSDPAALRAQLKVALQHDVGVFEMLWENRELCRLILSGAGSMQFGFLVDGFSSRVTEFIKFWLTYGQAHGLYRLDLDMALASSAVAGMYDRVARDLIHAPAKPDLAHWVVELQRMVARGLGTPRLMTALEQIGSQELRESPLTKADAVVPPKGQHVHPR